MCLGGGRRLIFLSVLGLLVISLLFILMWVCSNSCRVPPIPIPPALTNKNAIADAAKSLHELKLKLKLSDVVVEDAKSNHQLLLPKYFSGRRAFAFAAPSQNAFKDSKRRVPSCPDPLHN